MTFHDPENTRNVRNVRPENKWAEREAGLRHCWYCGSLHPLDLLEVFQNDRVSEYSGSDWKYGWPHKFYVEVDSGRPAVPFYRVNDSEVDRETYQRAVSEPDFMRRADTGGKMLMSGNVPGTGTLHLKFYTGHLQDLPEGDFERVCQLVKERFSIEFTRDEVGFKYRAPYHGYQVSWRRGTDPADAMQRFLSALDSAQGERKTD